MKCYNCPYYSSGHLWNTCDITGCGYFRERENCTLVNDDGTINKSDPFFADDPNDTGLRGDEDPFDEADEGRSEGC